MAPPNCKGSEEMWVSAEQLGKIWELCPPGENKGMHLEDKWQSATDEAEAVCRGMPWWDRQQTLPEHGGHLTWHLGSPSRPEAISQLLF